MKNITLCKIYLTLCIHSPIEGHIYHFGFGAIIKKATINISVQFSMGSQMAEQTFHPNKYTASTQGFGKVVHLICHQQSAN